MKEKLVTKRMVDNTLLNKKKWSGFLMIKSYQLFHIDQKVFVVMIKTF